MGIPIVDVMLGAWTGVGNRCGRQDLSRARLSNSPKLVSTKPIRIERKVVSRVIAALGMSVLSGRSGAVEVVVGLW